MRLLSDLGSTTLLTEIKKTILPLSRRYRRYKGVATAINRHQNRRLASDGCQSGRLGTPGKRVYRKVPRVRIPPHPPDFALFPGRAKAEHPADAELIG
jgi:hypothetical protein